MKFKLKSKFKPTGDPPPLKLRMGKASQKHDQL